MPSTTTIPQTGNRKKKSVSLTTDELKFIRKYQKSFGTDTDFAEDMGVGRPTILRVALLGSGSEATINTIREKIKGLVVEA